MAQQYNPLIKHGFQKFNDYSLPVAGADTLGGVKVGSGLSIDENGVLSGDGESYELPVAAADTLGGVKVGSGLSIDANGVLSGDSYSLPVAGANTLGGIKVGSGLSIDANGVLSAGGGGGSTPHMYQCVIQCTDPSAVTANFYQAFVFNNLLFIDGQFTILDTPSGNFLKVVYDSDESDVFTVQFLQSYPYDAQLIDDNNDNVLSNITGFARTNTGYNTIKNDTGQWPTGRCTFKAIIPVAITVQS